MYQGLNLKLSYLSEKDRALIKKAYEFSYKYHAGQKRKSGEPYIIHELETASFIAELKLDAKAIAAALLHDICEDTSCDLAKIKKEFGREVANLVDGVTKLSKIRITRRFLFIKTEKEMQEFDRQIETLRKMFLAMARDIRVIIIKLADRLHNMKTLEFVPLEKRYRIAKETLEIYAPLADRLGMGSLKGELEDLSFKWVNPKEYDWLKKQVALKFKERLAYLDKFKKILAKKLFKEGIHSLEIYGRAKNIYSLWLKLKRYDNDLSRIYDLVALRVIVNSVEDCYKALGIINNTWRPVVGRLKDYIAIPKPNGYQSLHTTIFGPDGQILEIQIRTKRMHDQAENGIAAHWHYAQKKSTLDYIRKRIRRVPYEDLVWIKEMIKWQKALSDNKELANSLELDFFSDRIFVYTPKGDVKDLPLGATPIDFAYSIHTEIGQQASGAKVNHKMVELSHPLQNGDIVEIFISKKSKGPKRDWLEFCKTSLARSKIRISLKENHLI